MSVTLIILVGVSLMFIGSLFLIRNILLKNEKLEEITIRQYKFIDDFQTVIEEVDSKLNEVDEAGHFRSDDEVGFFFNAIMTFKANLARFKRENN